MLKIHFVILYFEVVKGFCFRRYLPRYIFATEELGGLELELSESDLEVKAGTISIVVGRNIPRNLKFLSPTLNIN